MKNPTLIILPGLLCDETMWRETCAELAGCAECQVIDHGCLDSIEAMAANVLAKVGASRFSIAGHSMGGRVALEVLRQAPQRVLRIALLDSGFDAIRSGEAGEKERAGRHELIATAEREGMRRMGEKWARGMVHPDRLGTPLFEEILRMVESRSLESFKAQIRALLARPDATSLLPAIDCPTLLLCGREDLWSPVARHEDMRLAIPGAELVVVEHCGHMSPSEHPVQVAHALMTWLHRPVMEVSDHAI